MIKRGVCDNLRNAFQKCFDKTPGAPVVTIQRVVLVQITFIIIRVNQDAWMGLLLQIACAVASNVN